MDYVIVNRLYNSQLISSSLLLQYQPFLNLIGQKHKFLSCCYTCWLLQEYCQTYSELSTHSRGLLRVVTQSSSYKVDSLASKLTLTEFNTLRFSCYSLLCSGMISQYIVYVCLVMLAFRPVQHTLLKLLDKKVKKEFCFKEPNSMSPDSDVSCLLEY